MCNGQSRLFCKDDKNNTQHFHYYSRSNVAIFSQTFEEGFTAYLTYEVLSEYLGDSADNLITYPGAFQIVAKLYSDIPANLDDIYFKKDIAKLTSLLEENYSDFNYKEFEDLSQCAYYTLNDAAANDDCVQLVLSKLVVQ